MGEERNTWYSSGKPEGKKTFGRLDVGKRILLKGSQL
jgi:hypothetical protein